jgi:hypothetical protein
LLDGASPVAEEWALPPVAEMDDGAGMASEKGSGEADGVALRVLPAVGW